MKNTLLFYLLFLLLYSCASIDLPPGGQKDVVPPKVLSSSPDSLETFFTGNTIRLTFDEYFVLNNLNQSLIVSPPLKTQPKTVIRGKSLILQLQEPLKPNLTYQFYFADGIKDLNEGNPTKNLRLVFSTGPAIDTAYLSGVVLDAFTLSPVEDAKVLLYKTLTDSQLITSSPYYITKTDKSGSYAFNNISDGQYFGYVLFDENNNNRLDISERVGFKSESINANSNDNILYLSKEKNPTNLRILDHKEISKGQFQVVISSTINTPNISLHTTQTILDISKDKRVPWHYGQKSDTIYYYLNTKENIDTISVLLEVDSTTFTVTSVLQNKTTTQPTIQSPNTHNPTLSYPLQTNYAVRKYNEDGFNIFDITDSIPLSFDQIVLNKNVIEIASNYKEGHNYRLTIEPKSITYFNGQSNQKDTFLFQTQSSEQTGEIEVEISFDSAQQTNHPFFCVVAQQNTIITSQKLTNDTILVFSFLSPGEYSIYVFEDKNENGVWDDLHYLKNVAPEPIWRNFSPIEVRSKWKTNGISQRIK